MNREKSILSEVTITRKGAERVESGHLWIYRSDLVEATARHLEGGEIVWVRGQRGRLLGSAFYSSKSQIALRMLTWGESRPDRALLRLRLLAAARLRQDVAKDAVAYRLVHGEGDLLPALVVDKYGDYLVMQLLSQGTDRLKNLWVELLEELYSPKAIVERSDVGVRQLEGLPERAEVVRGELPVELTVELNGIRFGADLLRGQKTGLFLDQRENYAAAMRYAHGRALDCFTFAGGFALHMARRASHVTALDISSAAVELAKRNAKLNGVENISFETVNVFDKLKALDEAGEVFDTIVLDPPAFAKNKAAVEGALRGYKEINLRAMKMLRPGGVLVTCTCSYNVSEADFLTVLRSAASDAGRSLQLLEKRQQSRDHPVLLQMPETYYLKCMVIRTL